MKTVDYLDAVKKEFNLPSDYALSKLLGIGHSAISRYRNKGGTFDDVIGIKIADLLELDPCIVLADLQAERAHDENLRGLWHSLAESLRTAAAVAVCAIVIGGMSPQTHAQSSASLNLSADNLYIMRTRRQNVVRDLIRKIWHLIPIPTLGTCYLLS